MRTTKVPLSEEALSRLMKARADKLDLQDNSKWTAATDSVLNFTMSLLDTGDNIASAFKYKTEGFKLDAFIDIEQKYADLIG